MNKLNQDPAQTRRDLAYLRNAADDADVAAKLSVLVEDHRQAAIRDAKLKVESIGVKDRHKTKMQTYREKLAIMRRPDTEWTMHMNGNSDSIISKLCLDLVKTPDEVVNLAIQEYYDRREKR